MIAKKASGLSAGRATSMTTKKTRAPARALAPNGIAKDKTLVRPIPEQADDFADVMKTLGRVNAKNDELADRINRLVTSLR